MENTIGYRDQHLTHIPWMPRIPAHWACYRLKSKVDNLIAPLESHVEDDLKYIALEHIESWTGKVKYTNLSSGNSSQLKRFEKNDVLFSKLRPYLAKVVIAQERGGCVGELLVLRSKNCNELYQNYLAHFLRAKPIIDAIDGSTFGAKMPRASWDFIGNLILPLPPPSEQAAIVKYLDYMTRRIDKAIRVKKKLIQLLNEQKQVIIHQAVTRGLNPDVPLKDSGVPWLGMVPEHWEVVRLKSIVAKITSGSRGWSNYIANEGPLFIRIGNLTRGSIGLDHKDEVRLNLPPSALSESRRTKVQPFDILISITAYIGSIAVVPEGFEEAYISQHVACCRLIFDRAEPKWIAYVLLSEVGKVYGQLSMYGGTKQGLSLNDVKNYIVLLPSKEEQRQLVDWIEQSERQITIRVNAVEKQIALLHEYRTRLIADVVTGQIDVRELAAQLPDEQEDVEPFDLEDVEEVLMESEQDD